MNARFLPSRRGALKAIAGLTLAALAATAAAQQTTRIRFQLDWRFEGPAALFVLPVAKGYFKQEGLDELFVKAKAFEVERDAALRRDPYFDWSQAMLQIAIVLASVHLIIGNFTLLALSGGLGGLGILLLLNGFTLLVPLPFLG